MSRRTHLKLAVGAMAVLGAAMVSLPFLYSLSINPKQENDAWGACDVSDLAQGAMKQCGWAAVYRRTSEDMASVDKFASLLADPDSIHSSQPSSAKNHWRSENPYYFVFKPWAPHRRCKVWLETSRKYYSGWEPPENVALTELPYFMEPCEGRTWDTSGRLYKRDGYPPEQNLAVPSVRWISPTKVLIYSSN